MLKEYRRLPPLKEQLAKGNYCSAILKSNDNSRLLSSFYSFFLSFLPYSPFLIFSHDITILSLLANQRQSTSLFAYSILVVLFLGGIDVDSVMGDKCTDDTTTDNPISFNAGVVTETVNKISPTGNIPHRIFIFFYPPY